MFSPSNLRLKIATVNFIQFFTGSKHTLTELKSEDHAANTYHWYWSLVGEEEG